MTLPSGLQYKILTEGTGPKPTAGDSVVCNYRGTLINGKEFDALTNTAGRRRFRHGRDQGMDGSTATHASGIEVATFCSA